MNQSLLDKIQEYENRTFDVYVPVLGKEVNCGEVAVDQRKKLMDAAAADTMGKEFSHFADTGLTGVLAANCSEPIDQFTRVDRAAVFLQLHAASVLDKPRAWKNHVKKIAESGPPSTLTIQEKDLKLHLEVPNLERDAAFNLRFRDSISPKDTLGGVDLETTGYETMISTSVMFEFAKYITGVEIKDEKEDVTTWKPDDCVRIVENLPIVLYQQLQKFIEGWRAYEKALCTPPNHKEIDVDVSFVTGL